MTKENYSEVNYFPIPAGIAEILRQTGLTFYCYYDNTRSNVKDFTRRRTFHFYCLLQLLEGDGLFVDDTHPAPVPFAPGQGLIITPGTQQEYGAGQDYFVEDSVCFYGPAADAFFQAGILRQGIINFGKERLLLPIINKIRAGTLTGYLEAHLMLLQLLLDLHRRNSGDHDSPSRRNLERLLDQINKSPQEWWTVKAMAAFCNISENYLRRLFLRQTGMTPKEYIEQVKMRRAAELLNSTELKINEIAGQLGYTDPYHFIRRFTAKTGIAPGRYRKTHSNLLR